jgi:hypothetical protein
VRFSFVGVIEEICKRAEIPILCVRFSFVGVIAGIIMIAVGISIAFPLHCSINHFVPCPTFQMIPVFICKKNVPPFVGGHSVMEDLQRGFGFRIFLLLIKSFIKRAGVFNFGACNNRDAPSSDNLFRLFRQIL